VGKFHFNNSETRKKHFSTKAFEAKYQFSKSMVTKAPCFPFPRSCARSP